MLLDCSGFFNIFIGNLILIGYFMGYFRNDCFYVIVFFNSIDQIYKFVISDFDINSIGDFFEVILLFLLKDLECFY